MARMQKPSHFLVSWTESGGFYLWLTGCRVGDFTTWGCIPLAFFDLHMYLQFLYYHPDSIFQFPELNFSSPVLHITKQAASGTTP